MNTPPGAPGPSQALWSEVMGEWQRGMRVTVTSCECADRPLHVGKHGTVRGEDTLIRYVGGTRLSEPCIVVDLDDWYKVPCYATGTVASDVPAPKKSRPKKVRNAE